MKQILAQPRGLSYSISLPERNVSNICSPQIEAQLDRYITELIQARDSNAIIKYLMIADHLVQLKRINLNKIHYVKSHALNASSMIFKEKARSHSRANQI